MMTILDSQLAMQADVPGEPRPPVLDIVIPVYNEEDDLAAAVERLRAHIQEHVPYPSRVTVADNASTDGTVVLAKALAAEYPDVRVVQISKKGRGGALSRVWRTSDAEIVAYCDVDLSTDLNALMPLIAPLVSGHSDIAIGTRLSRGSRVVRGPKREMISRCYNLLLRTTMRAHFSDAQCGFKAMRADVARRLLPYVEDTGWFFDTELLVLAERVGLRIAEVPVDWIDDPDSSVDIVATAVADLRGCVRIGWAFARGALPITELRATLGREGHPGPNVDGVPHGMVGQVVRFCAVGATSTLAYALLYLLLHSIVGAQAANFAALAVTAVVNTAVNRRFTFGVRGSERVVRDQLVGLCVFGFGWALTAVSLACLHALAPDVGRGIELIVLVAANLVATATRFVGLRILFTARARASEGETA